MAALAIALTLFLGTHFAMSHPLRAPLAARLGQAGFQIAYTRPQLTRGWA